MTKILGLDLGTNSIGWAVVDDKENRIRGIGSYVFPEGINREPSGKEISKNETRRLKRQVRRQGFRRKLRKERLAKLLIAYGMFPDINKLYKKSEANNENFRTKFQCVIRQKKLPEELRQFFAINPYEARAKAIEREKLTLLEIGRIFYQFAQRRGYKESLQGSEEDGKIYEGNVREGKTGILETKEKTLQYGSLGAYLYHENPHKKRLRNRYTLRSMYEGEFDLIWQNQKDFYPDILTEELKKEIGGIKRENSTREGILFFQRPLRSQKHLIGKCVFESSKTVCPVSAIPFELFRTFQIINNIRDGERKLNEEERAIALEVFNSKDRAFEFSLIKKKLSVPDGNYNYADKDKLPGNRTICNFRKIFGKKYWNELSLNEQEEIWHLKQFAKDPEWLQAYAAKKWELAPKAIDHLQKFRLAEGYARLSRKAIMNILPYLERGYLYDKAVLLGGLRSAFGAADWNSMPHGEKLQLENLVSVENEKKKIDKIKEYLQSHYKLTEKQLNRLYHHSVVRENPELKAKLPEPDNVRNPIVQQALFEIRKLVNMIIEKYGKPDEIKVELARELKSSKKERENIRYRQQENEANNDRIKAMLDEHHLPHTRSNIQKVFLWEEAHKKCPFTGVEIGFKELFDEGYVQVEHIVPYSLSLNDSLQNKTLCLADKNREKGNRTPYQAFGQSGEWEKMKDIAYSVFKGNYKKYQRFISKVNPDADDFISRQLNDTRYISSLAKEYLKQICPKVEITQGTVTSLLRHYWGLDGILSETYQVGDIEDGEYYAAIGQQNEILELVGWNKNTKNQDQERLKKKGTLINGNVKDGILYPKKERTDHRHHAIDALAVACSKRKYLQQIATLKGKGVNERNIRFDRDYQIEKPWPNFWADARLAVEQILVAHKKNNRILNTVKKQLYDYTGKPRYDKKNGRKLFGKGTAARGALHEESVYGKHMHGGKEYFHIRKPVDFIQNHKHVAKIVDPGVRSAVEKRLLSFGLDIYNSKGYKLTDLPTDRRKEVFFKVGDNGEKIPQIYLPNKNGDPVPVRKVRIRETIVGALQVKARFNQYVNPKNNDRILIYKDGSGELKYYPLSFWEAVERRRQKESLNKLPSEDSDGELINVIQKNDMFLLYLDEQHIDWTDISLRKVSDHLFKVQKIGGNKSYFEICFRPHSDARLDKEAQTNYKYIKNFGDGTTGWKTFSPIKVRITPLGQIQRWP